MFNIIKQIFLSHLGRIVISIILFFIGGLMSPYGTIGEHLNYQRDITVWDIIMWIGIFVLIYEFLIFFVYGWIINPLKKRFKRNKK